jgi:signal transduction histidine kinase
MTAEVKNKIFEPFYTTKPVGQGTGLGLSVVQGIVTAHHGKISVSTSPGKGSKFEVLIPLGGSRKSKKI